MATSATYRANVYGGFWRSPSDGFVVWAKAKGEASRFPHRCSGVIQGAGAGPRKRKQIAGAS
jgi:hypothetical protein